MNKPINLDKIKDLIDLANKIAPLEKWNLDSTECDCDDCGHGDCPCIDCDKDTCYLMPISKLPCEEKECCASAGLVGHLSGVFTSEQGDYMGLHPNVARFIAESAWLVPALVNRIEELERKVKPPTFYVDQGVVYCKHCHVSITGTSPKCPNKKCAAHAN